MQRKYVPVMVSFAVLCSLFFALTALAQEQSASPANNQIEVPLLVELSLDGAEPLSATLPITLTIDVGPLLQGGQLLTTAVNVRVRVPITDTTGEGETEDLPDPQEPLPPTATLTPTDVVTPTVPATEDLPVATANANLRAGPSTEFAIVGGTETGEVLDLVARNEAGDWYQLASGGWIAAFLVDNAPEELPLATEIPTPVPPVTPTVAATTTVAVTSTPAAQTPILVPTPTAGGIDDVPISNANAFLRSGPNTEFPIIGSVVTGEALLLTGRTEAADWFQLRSGEWIAAFLVDGAPGNLPVAAEIPTLGTEAEAPEPEADESESVPAVETPVPLAPTPAPEEEAP